MKSNIGFVFVVNSEKAFGRFVKESAGEEEMTSCSSSGEWLISSNFKLSSRRRESSSREREESREALRQNLSGKRIPNFLFGTSNQIFGFFSFPPPQGFRESLSYFKKNWEVVERTGKRREKWQLLYPSRPPASVAPLTRRHLPDFRRRFAVRCLR